MKKLIFILFTIFTLNSFGQSWYDMRGPMWMHYQKNDVIDSVKMYFSGSNVNFTTSKSYFNFSKPVIIPGHIGLGNSFSLNTSTEGTTGNFYIAGSNGVIFDYMDAVISINPVTNFTSDISTTFGVVKIGTDTATTNKALRDSITMLLDSIAAKLNNTDTTYKVETRYHAGTALEDSINMLLDSIAALNARKQDTIPRTKTLYVDGNRTDSYTANGSLAKPFKTIGAATSVATNGMVIDVQAGTYSETVVLPNGVSLINHNSNKATINGNCTVTASSNISIRGIQFANGYTLTVNAPVSFIDCFAAGAVVVNNVVTQGYNFHIVQGTSGVTALTVTGSSAKFQLIMGTIQSTGDVPTINQTGGSIILNSVAVYGSRAGAVVTSTGGYIVGTGSQFINLAGGVAADLQNAATSSAPNMVANIYAVGNIVCGTAYSIIEGLQFGAVGALSGSALHYRPGSQVSNTPAGNIVATTVQAAINELDGEKLNSTDTATYLSKSVASATYALIDTASEWVSRTIYVSMPTDPQTPGSDVTGDGTALLPFATINKALNSIKNTLFAGIIIQLDSGTFNFSVKDKLKIIELTPNYNYKTGIITIKGTIGLYSENLTITNPSPFIIKCTSPTFTTNELNDMFMYNSASPNILYPIESNISDTIFTSAVTSHNDVGVYYTNVNFTDNNILLNFPYPNMLTITRIKANFSTTSYIFGTAITTCLLTNPQTTNYSFIMGYSTGAYSKFKVRSNSATIANLVMNSCDFNYCTVYNYGTRKTVGTGISLRDNSTLFSNGIISGFLTAVDYIADLLIIFKAGAQASFFKENTNILSNASNTSAGISFNTNTLCSYKNNYLIYNQNATSPVRFYVKTLYHYGATVITNYNPSSAIKCFTNLELGTFISIPNTYSEYQQKQSVTLADNSTDSIPIADLTYNRAIELKYTIQRGTNYRTGTCKILNTGTVYLFDPGDFIESADVGVTLDGVYQSGSSNIIKLKWTTTNTGTACTFTYDAYRQNF